jgi:hypothetical protein
MEYGRQNAYGRCLDNPLYLETDIANLVNSGEASNEEILSEAA